MLFDPNRVFVVLTRALHMTNVQLMQITKICVDVFKDLLEKMAHQVSVTTAALLKGGTKSMERISMVREIKTQK